VDSKFLIFSHLPSQSSLALFSLKHVSSISPVLVLTVFTVQRKNTETKAAIAVQHGKGQNVSLYAKEDRF
jgi:hypothetical protein